MTEEELIRRALAAVRESAGLHFTVADMRPGTTRTGRGSSEADAFLDLELSERRIHFVAECKARVDRAPLLSRVKSQLEPFASSGLPLLVAPHVSANMADRCRQLALNFIDTAGNCYLEDDGLFVLVKGNKLPEDTQGVSVDYRGGTSYGSLRLTFALLCKPALLAAPYRELVRVAGISLGTVGWIFYDLESRGLLSARGNDKQRHILDEARLQDEWATNFAHKLKPRLHAQRFSAADPSWWRSASEVTANFLWGGEVAASFLGGHLKPVTQTLYTKTRWNKNAVAKLVAAHRLRADPDGSIEIVESFWDFEDDNSKRGLVPSLLIYADLLAVPDPRASEAAALLKEQHLDHA